MKKFIYIAVILLLASCKVTKDKTSTKKRTVNDIDRSELEVIEVKREGGFVQKVYYPVFQPREKDSTVIDRKGSAEVTTVYKKDGSVQASLQCDAIWEHIERRLDERDKTQTALESRTKLKTEEISSKVLLYIMMGLVVITVIAMLYVSWSVKKNLKVLQILK